MRAEKGEAGTYGGRGRELTGCAGQQEAQRGARRGRDRHLRGVLGVRAERGGDLGWACPGGGAGQQEAQRGAGRSGDRQ